MQNYTIKEQIFLCLLHVASRMDAVQIIQKYGKRIIDQNDFIVMIRSQNSKIPQPEIEKFYAEVLGEFKAQAITTYIMNELLRKASKLQLMKQQPSPLRTPSDILHLIQKIIQRRNQEIERVFRIFDFDKDCMLNEQEFKYFVEYFIPTILPEEYKQLRISYSTKNVCLYELMTWLQDGSAMRNSIKQGKQDGDPTEKIKQQQPKVQNIQENPTQRIASPYSKPTQQPTITVPQIKPPSSPFSKPTQQPQIPKPQQRQINPILESILYEDPSQANILQSDIQFQNYIILDYNLPGVQDFLNIFNDLYRRKQLYIDPQFKANSQSLGSKLSQYQWKRLSEIWQECKIFVKDDTQSRFGLGKWISQKDIKQGELGDCYFLSTLSSMACRWPDIVLDLFLTQQSNPCGIYAVRLCIDGVWKAIIVDDLIPTKGSQPAFSQSQSKEIWVILLEKAWAKAFSSYSNIISGESREVMRSLTGGPTWTLKTDQPDFKAQFIGCIKRKCIMTVGTFSAGKNQQLMGLIPEHAYSILKIRVIKHPTKGEVTLIKLRNPWGEKEWNGEWCDSSNSWTQELRTQLRVSEKAEDGIFYMSFEDFIVYFQTIYVGYFQKNYVYQSLSVISKAKNSLYFTFDIPSDGEYYFTAIQQSSRHFKEKYTNFTYSPIRLALGLVGKKGYKFENLKQDLYSDLYIGELMEKGRYVLAVKIKWQFWNEHDFVVSSYGEKLVKLKQLQKDQNFIYQILLDRARQNEKKKPLSQDSKCIEECSEMDPVQGLGYWYYKNNGTKILDLKCQFPVMTGLKLKKPDRGNMCQVLLEPNQERLVIFSIKPEGFQLQQQRSYTLK